MLARVFEATDLSTVQISLIKEHTEKVRPPRALFCGFPYGLALGKPNDADFQHRVLAATFSLLDRAASPVLEEFPEDIVPAATPATLAPDRPADPAFELTGLRGYYTQFVEQYGRTAVGLSAVPQTRFRGIVRLLERYVADGSLNGMEHPEAHAELARALGIDDVTRFVKPMERPRLAQWYRAASVVCVPSYSESFGLVALEAQACGTPVVAAAVGGLSTAVVDGRTGFLVRGHGVDDFADALARIATDPHTRESMSRAAVKHAQGFGWELTARKTLAAYRTAAETMAAEIAAEVAG